MTSEAMKAEVLAAVAKWRPRLRLLDWSIAYEWDAHLPDHASMQCVPQQDYRRILLKVRSTHDGAPEWQTLEKEVLHELCHCLTSELSDGIDDLMRHAKVGQIAYDLAESVTSKADERLTEWLARLLWEAYEHSDWDAEPPLTEP